MQFGELYKWFCFASCGVSLLFNGALIYIVQQRQGGIGFYRFFTHATVLIGVLYSLAFAVAQPFWYAGPGMLGFFSIAPWNSRVMLIRVAFQIWFITFVLVLLSSSCSFLYRYGRLCSPRIVSCFETPRRLALAMSLLLIIMTWWLYNCNYVMFQESREVRWKIQAKFAAEYKVDLLSSYVLSVNINDELLAGRSIIGALYCTVMMQIQIMIMCFCGWKIHKTIKVRTMSERLKQIHSKALKMMISQTLNPAMFLFVPACINLLGMFVDTDFGDLPKVLAFSFALFPIFNPLIVIYFTDEYKRFILGHSASITQVSVTNTRDRKSVSDAELMKFAVIFCYFCIGLCVLSCLLNGLLIVIVQMRRAGIGFYRYFTLSTVLIGCLYSLSFAAAQPFWYAGPGMLGFFSIAPWSTNELLIPIVFQTWFTCFILILVCMMNSFIYRYGLLCSPFIVTWFTVPRRFAIMMSFNIAFCVWWLYNDNYFLFAESRAVRQIMQEKFSAEYNVDLLSSYVLTVDIVNDGNSAERSIIGALLITTLMQLQILVICYCGWQIHRTVKIRTMSVKLKRLHGKALKMMISQALNPVLFLYAPSFINLFGMFVDTDTGDRPKILAMLLALFPIFNPLIVIYFTDEYKRFILGRKSSSIVQLSASREPM